MSYSDTDDDLFEYDPDQEIHQELNTPPSSERLSSLSTDQKQFLNNIKDKFESDDEDDFDLEKGSVRHGQTKLAASFQSAASYFLYDLEYHSYTMSSHRVLDELTEGRFSLLNTFYFLENKIAKTMNFINMSTNVFTDEKETFLEIVKELFGVELSDLHVETCYLSHIRIARHSLTVNRSQYKAISKLVDVPVREELVLDNNDTIIDPHSYGYSSFIKNLRSNILTNIFSDETISDIAESMGMNVRLYKEEDQKDS